MKILAYLLCALLVVAISVFIFTCGDDDDDDDDNDDSGDDDDDDDNDDTGENLPVCSPYIEPDLWLDMSELLEMYGEFLDERDAEGIVTATVSVEDDEITITKGTYDLAIQWLRDDGDHPFTDGQTVNLYQTGGAGTDGCCDTEMITIWDENWNLLLGYAWNHGLSYNQSFNDETYEAGSEWTDVCRYIVGERPREGETDWSWVHGMSLSGYYQDSEYLVTLPGGLAMSGDDLLEVHLPVGYRGEIFWNDETWPTRYTIIEIVAVLD